jgi:hypothetical protein
VNGGLANGFLQRNNIDPTVGWFETSGPRMLRVRAWHDDFVRFPQLRVGDSIPVLLRKAGLHQHGGAIAGSRA